MTYTFEPLPIDEDESGMLADIGAQLGIDEGGHCRVAKGGYSGFPPARERRHW